MPFSTDPAGSCPVCKRYPDRAAMPLRFRWVRLLFREASFRECFCGWRGLRLHAPRARSASGAQSSVRA
jgi:hypothetical protein